jgi:hypothetical protein
MVVYGAEGRAFIKRYLAGPGQTIAETADGLSIDDKPPPTEVVDARYRYRYRDEAGDPEIERTGTLVRKHLGARSYLTLRTGPPHTIDTWHPMTRARAPRARHRSGARRRFASRAGSRGTAGTRSDARARLRPYPARSRRGTASPRHRHH